MSHIDTHQPDYGTGEKTLPVYLAGTITCVLLTLLPFAAVMFPLLSKAATLGLVFTAALAQFIIQIVCFLQLNARTEQARMNLQSFSLCLFILFVLIAGSIWIMQSLSYNMGH
jgi:cytochrome o ubiquinol oxidase subunit IV